MRPTTVARACACLPCLLALPLLIAAAPPGVPASQRAAWDEWSRRVRALYYVDGTGQVAPLPPPAARYFAAAAAQRAGRIKELREDLAEQRDALPRLNEQARFAAEPRLRTQEWTLEGLGERMKLESKKNLRPDFSPRLGKPAVGGVGSIGARVRVVAVLGADEMLVTLPDGSHALARGWPTAGVAEGAPTSAVKAAVQVTGTERLDPPVDGVGEPVFVLEPFNPDPYVRTVSGPQFLAHLKRRGLTPAALLEFARRHGHKPDAAGAAAVVAYVERSAAPRPTPTPPPPPK